jgi:hypothetical protein
MPFIIKFYWVLLKEFGWGMKFVSHYGHRLAIARYWNETWQDARK